MRKEPREAKSLAEPFSLVLSRIPGGVRDALSRSDPSPRERILGEEKNPSRGENPSRSSPGLESLVLSENHPRNLAGPGRPARGTLVSTVPTVAPGPATGTLESLDAGVQSYRRGNGQPVSTVGSRYILPACSP